MTLTTKQKWILAGTVVVTGIALYGQKRKWWLKPSDILYPPAESRQGNRIFVAVRDKQELQPLLIQEHPLLLNFVYRGEGKSNSVTGALQRIVAYDTSKWVNMVDIEADEQGNKDLLVDYTVNSIPTIVALHKQLPVSSYVEDEETVDYEKLKSWVESVAK